MYGLIPINAVSQDKTGHPVSVCLCGDGKRKRRQVREEEKEQLNELLDAKFI